MIDGIGNGGLAGRIGAALAQAAGRTQQPSSTAATAVSAGSTGVQSAAADMAAQGAPVDTDKVARIRAAIAGGSYSVDPQAIAAKMVSLDLGGDA